MALTNTNQHGATYKFGFAASDAPGITGFTAKQADLKFVPEVTATAMGGEGEVLALAITKPDKERIEGTFTGYVDRDTWDATAVPNGFAFISRAFFITSKTEPRKSGEFWEVTIEAFSVAGIASTAAV